MKPTIPDPCLGYESQRGHYSQAPSVGSCQSLSFPASTSGREPKSHPARALAETQVVGVRGVMPLFPEDVSLRLPVPGGSHLRKGSAELQTSGRNS